MATIIEGAIWTLTNEAASYLENEGVIQECLETHITGELLEVDLPVFHVTAKGFDLGMGYTTIQGWINEAHRKVEGQ